MTKLNRKRFDCFLHLEDMNEEVGTLRKTNLPCNTIDPSQSQTDCSNCGVLDRKGERTSETWQMKRRMGCFASNDGDVLLYSSRQFWLRRVSITAASGTTMHEWMHCCTHHCSAVPSRFQVPLSYHMIKVHGMEYQ